MKDGKEPSEVAVGFWFFAEFMPISLVATLIGWLKRRPPVVTLPDHSSTTMMRPSDVPIARFGLKLFGFTWGMLFSLVAIYLYSSSTIAALRADDPNLTFLSFVRDAFLRLLPVHIGFPASGWLLGKKLGLSRGWIAWILLVAVLMGFVETIWISPNPLSPGWLVEWLFASVVFLVGYSVLSIILYARYRRKHSAVKVILMLTCGFAASNFLFLWVRELRKSLPQSPPPHAAAPPARVVPQPIRVGGTVQAAMLVKEVQALYPPEAKLAGIQGTVRLTVTIGKGGMVQDIKLVGGHPMLAPAAEQAVRQWVYRPTKINDQPVEVVTYVEVKFSLSR